MACPTCLSILIFSVPSVVSPSCLPWTADLPAQHVPPVCPFLIFLIPSLLLFSYHHQCPSAAYLQVCRPYLMIFLAPSFPFFSPCYLCPDRCFCFLHTPSACLQSCICFNFKFLGWGGEEQAGDMLGSQQRLSQERENGKNAERLGRQPFSILLGNCWGKVLGRSIDWVDGNASGQQQSLSSIMTSVVGECFFAGSVWRKIFF